MKKVIVLVGKSGTWKSTLQNLLVQRLGLNAPKSFTTRKKRNEKDNGYEFITKTEFKKLQTEGNIICSVKYNEEYYWMYIHNILENNLNVLILEPKGVEELLNISSSHGILVEKIIYLKMDESKRRENMKFRGDQKEKIENRMKNDWYFEEYFPLFNLVLNCNNNLEEIYKQLVKKLKEDFLINR